MAYLDAYLKLGADRGASDLHLTVGRPPLIRLDGELIEVESAVLSSADIEALLYEVIDPASVEELNHNGSIDLAYAAPDGSRFRLNVFRQLYGLAAICRLVPVRVPRLTDLALPAVLAELSGLPSGLVLVTGGPGTGKTTTLAALIGEINATRNVNVITLDDPVEFFHE